MRYKTAEIKLYHYLETQKSRIISKDKLRELFQDNDYPDKVISQLRKRKLLLYILNGYYYIRDAEELRFDYTNYTALEMVSTVLNKLKIRWYFGLQTALEKNNILWQSHTKIIILNDSLSRKRTILGTTIEFRKIDKRLFSFGVLSFKTKNQLIHFYSDANKTLLDYLYFRKNPPEELIFVTDKEIYSYMSRYPKITQKRARKIL